MLRPRPIAHEALCHTEAFWHTQVWHGRRSARGAAWNSRESEQGARRYDRCWAERRARERRRPARESLERSERHVSPKRATAVAWFVTTAVVGGVVSVLVWPFLDVSWATSGEGQLVSSGAALREEAPDYAPPLPQRAPERIRPVVMSGYEAVRPSRWQESPGDDVEVDGGATPPSALRGLGCGACHFEGGLTRGGENGGISLVGVHAKYPVVDPGTGEVRTLRDRIASCYRDNLGRRPPDNPELQSISVYLRWISGGVPTGAQPRWLTVQPLEVSSAPENGAGERVYRSRCSMCHGQDGMGTEIAPPVWGPKSFTHASRMAREAYFARFVYDNMPRQTPILSDQQAADVAAFVLSQLRPGERR